MDLSDTRTRYMQRMQVDQPLSCTKAAQAAFARFTSLGVTNHLYCGE